MKISFLSYVCDGDDGTCGEESPAESSWPDAKKAARKAGWQIGARQRTNDAAIDLCPEHAR